MTREEAIEELAQLSSYWIDNSASSWGDFRDALLALGVAEDELTAYPEEEA